MKKDKVQENNKKKEENPLATWIMIIGEIVIVAVIAFVFWYK